MKLSQVSPAYAKQAYTKSMNSVWVNEPGIHKEVEERSSSTEKGEEAKLARLISEVEEKRNSRSMAKLRRGEGGGA